MVFRFAHQNFVAWLQTRAQVALRHQVDRLGGAARPDDVVGRRRMDQLRHLAARLLEAGGQILRRPMLAAVHGGGVIAIKLLRGVDHRLQFQCGGGAVQIDTVLRERGKLLAKKAGIKRRHTLIVTGLSRWVILSYFAAGDKRSCLLGLIAWQN